MNITQKFILYLILMSFIPLSIVGAASFFTSANLLREENDRYTQELVNAQRDYLELQQSQIESLISNLSGVEAIRSVLDANILDDDSFTRLNTQAQIGYILNGYINIEDLVSIDIFALNGAHYTVGDTLVVDSIRTEVKDYLFELTLNGQSPITWVGVEENVNANSRYPKVVTATSMLYKFDRASLRQVPTALLLVNYNINGFYNYFSQVKNEDGGYFMVVDQRGKLVYHPQEERIGESLPSGLFAALQSKTNYYRVDGTEMLINSADSKQSGWIVVSLVPVNSFSSKTAIIRNTTLFTLAISFGVVAFLAYLYNRQLVAPIQGITARFKSLPNSKSEDITPLPIQSQDEIGELVRWFNLFLENMIAKEQAEAERERLIADLKIANEQAKESNRLKSEFLATMSHELRTPLNAIIGYTGIMKENMGMELPPRSRQMLERVYVNSERLLELINDVLDLSRIEAGHFEMNQQWLVPQELADNWRLMLGGLAENKGLGFSVEVDSQLQRIYGDAHLLGKIATNLVGNAIKFTQEGSISLQLLPDAERWCIVVKDTGIGIPPEAQSFIFEEFRQVDQSSKRRYGGTGLGLAIVRRLVEYMQGEIMIESVLGQGTTFTIRLPQERTQTK